MAGRAIGALLGVVAAIAFALSIASPKVPLLPAWWDGPPTIDGKTYDRMDIEVGPLGARHCFDAGANCKDDVTIDSTFQMIGYGELGAVGLMELFVIVLTISIWKIGDRRKGLARTALAVAMIVGAGSALLVVVGPNVRATDHDRVLDVGVPLGAGMFLMWGALAATGIASVLALRIQAEPLRLKPSMAQMPAPPPDVRELVREQHDQLRPSGNQAGAPLFEAAPQLRPLYDVEGAAPVPAPVQVPSRAPTPMDRASIRELAGMTPPPQQLERPESGPIEPPAPPPPPPLRVPTIAEGRLSHKVIAAPRPKPASVAPPVRASAPQLPRKSEQAIEKKTIAHAIPPPPTEDALPPPLKLPAKAARLATDPDDRLDTAMRETDAITTVEIDAEAKAKYVATQRERAAKHAAETAQMIDGSDTGVELVSRGALITDASVVVPEHTEQTTVPPPPPRVATTNAEDAKPTTEMAVPITTAPSTLPPPKITASVPASGPTPACPQCESPMAWVEEHLRFYCKQCRMYF